MGDLELGFPGEDDESKGRTDLDGGIRVLRRSIPLADDSKFLFLVLPRWDLDWSVEEREMEFVGGHRGERKEGRQRVAREREREESRRVGFRGVRVNF